MVGVLQVIERHFNGGREPVLRSLLTFLTRETQGSPFDFSGFGLIVPTRNAGRRLRSEMARLASAEGRAVLSPHVFTPGSLFPALADEATVAARPVRLLAAATSIQSMDPEERADAFGQSEGGTFADRVRLARFFLETRAELGEAGLDFATVVKHPNAFDRDRWKALAACERGYREVLSGTGREDPDDLAARIAEKPLEWFPGERLILAGVPDFSLRVERFLAEFARTGRVDVIVIAPTEESARFDALGRPEEEAFRNTVVDVPDAGVHVNRDVGEAVEEMVDRLERYEMSRSACVCGVGRPEVGKALSFEMECRSIKSHDPSGESFAVSPAGRFFRLLVGVCYGNEIEDLVLWLRDPFVARWAVGGSGGTERETSRESWIRESDRVREEALPGTLSDALDALNRRPGFPVFGKTLSLRRSAAQLADPFDLFSEKGIDSILGDLAKEDGTDEFAGRLAEIRACGIVGYSRSEARQFFFWAVGEAMEFPLYPEKDDSGIDILGWFELLWDERPWLQLADLWDGSIPSVATVNPLLPESLREDLEMGSHRTRDARDGYILGALCRLREKNGRVDLHVPARDHSGRIVQPSRLLFFTDSERLPERIERLTADAPAGKVESVAPKPVIVAGAGEQVDRWIEGLEKVSVTAFASWIRCPFSFFLENVAGYETVEPDRMEMDPMQFGTGVHAVLQALEENEGVSWKKLETVEDEAEAWLSGWCRKVFGSDPGLLLQLQIEGLRRRLRAAVRMRFEERRLGWRPLKVEWSFGDEADLVVEGVRMRGKIDLLEERDDEIRIVDYKTSDNRKAPLDAHCKRLSGRGGFDPSALLPLAGDPSRGWTNLQLPLYAAAVRKGHPGVRLRVGYGQLPRSVTESGLEEWPDFDEKTIDSGLEAAGKIIDFWKKRGFWPPVWANFRRSDAFPWSGPMGEAGWARGDLADLEESDQ